MRSQFSSFAMTLPTPDPRTKHTRTNAHLLLEQARPSASYLKSRHHTTDGKSPDLFHERRSMKLLLSYENNDKSEGLLGCLGQSTPRKKLRNSPICEMNYLSFFLVFLGIFINQQSPSPTYPLPQPSQVDLHGPLGRLRLPVGHADRPRSLLSAPPHGPDALARLLPGWLFPAYRVLRRPRRDLRLPPAWRRFLLLRDDHGYHHYLYGDHRLSVVVFWALGRRQGRKRSRGS